MKITEDLVMAAMIDSDDIVHSILILRLYDEYEKYSMYSSNKKKKPEISLIDFQSACFGIKKKISVMSENDETCFANKEILDVVKENFIMLKDCLSNFEFRDKNKVYHCMDLITKLECLLKLPLTFPFYLEKCLEIELGNCKSKTSQKMKR